MSMSAPFCEINCQLNGTPSTGWLKSRCKDSSGRGVGLEAKIKPKPMCLSVAAGSHEFIEVRPQLVLGRRIAAVLERRIKSIELGLVGLVVGQIGQSSRAKAAARLQENLSTPEMTEHSQLKFSASEKSGRDIAARACSVVGPHRHAGAPNRNGARLWRAQTAKAASSDCAKSAHPPSAPIFRRVGFPPFFGNDSKREQGLIIERTRTQGLLREYLRRREVAVCPGQFVQGEDI